jgi:PEP-CTERM motif
VPGSPASAALSYPTYGAYKAALEAAGFTWANSAQVQDLLGSLDFSSNAAAARAQAVEWAGVMSTLWFDDQDPLLGGLAENTSTPTGQRRHGLVFANLPSWGTFASSQDFSADSESSFGLWAFRAAPAAGPGASVPEPGAWALVGLALVSLGLQRRRAQAAAGACR